MVKVILVTRLLEERFLEDLQNTLKEIQSKGNEIFDIKYSTLPTNGYSALILYQPKRIL
ncbi:MAG: hypothetical protein KAU20_05810 [Nanoarchaeota archaeon]|nr:hypothetical protein [Nanoarchaeota archaeon]